MGGERDAGTGRIRAEIPEEARRLLFGETVDPALPALAHQLDVDRAHLVMLAEAGLLPESAAGALLREIETLEASDFAGLRGRVAPRGAYLAYEQVLIERTGPDVGGMLTFARSRNDLQATVFALRLRAWLADTVEAQLAVVAAVVRRARETADLVMPAYTHGQPAVPTTLGHYLAGIAAAVQRDTDGLGDVLPLLERCPMGAGAVGGTTAPIRPDRVAALLGFARPLSNSFDAVASRDAAMRALAAAAIAATTTSRFAHDLGLWLGEAGFLALPDHLVGSSSMMPQKRNPYFLEHVQGRAARPLGAFVAACTAVHAKPFTNCIAVGTEAVAEVEATLRSHREALLLLRLVVEGFQARPEAMRARAAGAYVEATELATRLAPLPGVGFRGAHALVGEAVSAASASGRPLAEVLGEAVAARGLPASAVAFGGPEDVVRQSTHVGGPGAWLGAVQRIEAWHAARSRDLGARRARWAAARDGLRAAVRALVDVAEVA
jgi:argininosuccinate lyase